MLNPQIKSKMQNSITSQFTKHLQEEFSEGLTLISAPITESEDYSLSIINFTFDNTDYHRDSAPYAITPNSDDYQDLINATEDFIKSHKSEDFFSPGYSINCILCTDTANPYNLINITLHFEHNFNH